MCWQASSGYKRALVFPPSFVTFFFFFFSLHLLLFHSSSLAVTLSRCDFFASPPCLACGHGNARQRSVMLRVRCSHARRGRWRAGACLSAVSAPLLPPTTLRPRPRARHSRRRGPLHMHVVTILALPPRGYDFTASDASHAASNSGRRELPWRLLPPVPSVAGRSARARPFGARTASASCLVSSLACPCIICASKRLA